MNLLIDELFEFFDQEKPPKDFVRFPFVEAIYPWMGAGRKRLSKQSGSFDKTVYHSLEKGLLSKLCTLCAPAMVLELALAKYSALNSGKTPRARYLHFVKERFHKKEGLKAFFNEYQELLRMVAVTIELWEIQARELLSRLEKDEQDLNHYFGDGKSSFGKVTEVEASLGDTHNGGRSVYKISFSNGKKLLYKPKESAIASSYHLLIDEINKRGLQPKLQGYRVLPRDGYGWEELVEHRECADRDEVKLYYERAGMLLGLVYLLDGNDLHHENIIASGAYPTIIDLETLFHNYLPWHTNPSENYVLKTGLLPSFLMGAMGKQGVDISGLGASPKQPYPMAQPLWKNLNTENMHLVYETKKTRAGKHTLYCNKKRIRAEDHVDDIVVGFNKIYEFLIRHQKDLLPIIEKMASCPVRFIVRATRFYGHILQRLKDPTVLLNSALREKEFGNLSKYLAEDFSDEMLPIIEEEKKSLLQGDIPFFYFYPKKRDLCSQGKIVMKDLFESSALEKVKVRIKNFNEQDRALQEFFIRRAFTIKKLQPHSLKKTNKRSSKVYSDEKEIDYLHEAKKIATKLKQKTFRLKEEITWIDLEADPIVEQYHLQPISDNLYAGKSGIALFFSGLAKFESHWKNEALDVMAPLRKRIREGKSHRLLAGYGLGGYSGIGGIVYSLTQMGTLLNEPSMYEEAKLLLESVEERHIEQDHIYDVIGGGAGLILSLSTLNAISPHKKNVQLVERIAEHLVKQSLHFDQGVAWASRSETPLLGYSHGVAGIALALLKASAMCKKSEFQEVAFKALQYERSFYSREKKNWPHFGLNSLEACGWCHGATGVGLARLASLALFPDQKMEEEIEIALQTTIKKLETDDKTNLCCGSLGKVEFLIEAAKKDRVPFKDVNTKFSFVAQMIKQNKSLSPGLMQGEAGGGYFLLRIHDQTLPQILQLTS